AATALDRRDHFDRMLRHMTTPSATTRTAVSSPLPQDGPHRRLTSHWPKPLTEDQPSCFVFIADSPRKSALDLLLKHQARRSHERNVEDYQSLEAVLDLFHCDGFRQIARLVHVG